MARSRLLSAEARSGLLVVLGVALGAVAFAIGLSPAASVTGLAIGILVVASGLAGTAPSGRATITVQTQAAYDQGLTGGLLVIAAMFAVLGEATAVAVFGGAAGVALLICLSTRYSIGPTNRHFL